MKGLTAHVDTFARDKLPPAEQQPQFLFERPEYRYPERLNCATALLDAQCEAGHGERTVFITPNARWSYAELRDKANRIARVLVEDLGLVPGNRVLLRAANNPMLVACWFAVVKAGGIAVTTMPLLRAGEIAPIIEKAEIGLALCDERLLDEMEAAAKQSDFCQRIVTFDGSGEPGGGAELERRMAEKDGRFRDVETASDDVVLIAFTSGTSGTPKGTMHFHRDVMAICDAFPRHVLRPSPEDIFIGSPPIGFTFGLGGLVTFPMRYGAASVLLEAAAPPRLAEAIDRFKATTCFTAPTAYRAVLAELDKAGSGAFDLSSLRACVSAGETLPLTIFEAWKDRTGVDMIDGIGATEMLHIFISSAPEAIRPGATGKPVPGYRAKVVDAEMNELPPGEIGHLAVIGPTGCRYLADERQRSYVRDGWNMTGDSFLMDEDGYFWFQARSDDMIVSSGYNISGPEVENALLAHRTVKECAVVGAADPDRGMIVKAFVVPTDAGTATPDLVGELQDFVKARIAPYKYPRAIEFLDALPKTETGKVQRFKLRAPAQAGAKP